MKNRKLEKLIPLYALITVLVSGYINYNLMVLIHTQQNYFWFGLAFFIISLITGVILEFISSKYIKMFEK